jgi:hypothetical protein
MVHRGKKKFMQNYGRKNLKGRGHSEDIGVDGEDSIEWILGKWGGKLWTGCIWLRIGTSGRPF